MFFNQRFCTNPFLFKFETIKKEGIFLPRFRHCCRCYKLLILFSFVIGFPFLFDKYGMCNICLFVSAKMAKFSMTSFTCERGDCLIFYYVILFYLWALRVLNFLWRHRVFVVSFSNRMKSVWDMTLTRTTPPVRFVLVFERVYTDSNIFFIRYIISLLLFICFIRLYANSSYKFSLKDLKIIFANLHSAKFRIHSMSC
jgi:hypothetical protein